jgi:membrane protein
VLALSAILGLVGQSEKSVQTVLDVISPLVSEDALGTIEPTLLELASSQTAGWALLLGAVLALWSASGYVGAFARAMNRIYEIGEGRPFWKLRPLMLLITLVAIALVALVLLMLVVSGPLAQSIGDQIGLGDQAVQVWNIAKWPVMLLAVIVIVAILYYATPNVQQPKFRWVSVGAVVAIVIWMVASAGFAFYVANFASYNKTYGSLAGVIVALLYLWLTNLALLFGAEVDSELERGRQLEAGMAAEKDLQLPPRDTRNIRKAEEKEAEDIAQGRRIREQHDDSSAQDTPPQDPHREDAR